MNKNRERREDLLSIFPNLFSVFVLRFTYTILQVSRRPLIKSEKGEKVCNRGSRGRRGRAKEPRVDEESCTRRDATKGEWGRQM